MKKILLVFAVMFAFVAFPTFASDAEFDSEYTSIESFDAGLVAMKIGADATINCLTDDGGGGFAVCSTPSLGELPYKTSGDFIASFNRQMRSTVLAVTAYGGFA